MVKCGGCDKEIPSDRMLIEGLCAYCGLMKKAKIAQGWYILPDESESW